MLCRKVQPRGVFTTVEHLRRSFFAKIVNGFQPYVLQPFLHGRSKSHELNVYCLAQLFSSKLQKQKTSQQTRQINSACQYRYGHRRAIITCLVHLFRRAKFVELNLFHLARLPFLHCRAKQRSQNLARRLFSWSVKLGTAETANSIPIR